MNQSNKNKGHQPATILNERIVEQIVTNETKKIALSEQKLRAEQELQRQQFDITIKTIEANKELLKAEPKEKRMTYITFGALGITTLCILIWFIIYCLNNGKDAFVLDLIKLLGWIVSMVLSYLAGKKVGKGEQPKDITEVQEVQ